AFDQPGSGAPLGTRSRMTLNPAILREAIREGDLPPSLREVLPRSAASPHSTACIAAVTALLSWSAGPGCCCWL
ncbi:hypothetical protein RA988_20000, partial [Mycobacteroides abscessus subsp. massiliense]